ncbi:HupE/UreJ family protein [bacterium]|nr:HupE/UreJ family protein [bacterium]
MQYRPVAYWLGLATLMLPILAHAHVEEGGAVGFMAGMHHPVSGWDHILAMVAVGLWGAQLKKPAIWLLPVAFPLVMAFGGFLGLIGVPIPGIEIGIALSAVVLGIMVLGKFSPPLWVALLLVAVFAVFHGHAHGTELPEGGNGMLYSIGFVISTGLLHMCGIALGMLNDVKRGELLVRAAGACVLLGGLFFLKGAVLG